MSTWDYTVYLPGEGQLSFRLGSAAPRSPMLPRPLLSDRPCSTFHMELNDPHKRDEDKSPQRSARGRCMSPSAGHLKDEVWMCQCHSLLMHEMDRSLTWRPGFKIPSGRCWSHGWAHRKVERLWCTA